jgi:hypothetical protein
MPVNHHHDHQPAPQHFGSVLTAQNVASPVPGSATHAAEVIAHGYMHDQALTAHIICHRCCWLCMPGSGGSHGAAMQRRGGRRAEPHELLLPAVRVANDMGASEAGGHLHDAGAVHTDQIGMTCSCGDPPGICMQLHR